MTMGAGKSKICWIGQQTEDREKSHAVVSLKAVCWQNILFFEGGQSFFYSDLQMVVRPTHIKESNICYSKSTVLNVKLI